MEVTQNLSKCLSDVRLNMDEQLIRLMNCEGTGSGVTPITYDSPVSPVLYELPKGLPVNAPLDATKLEPGVKVTLNPAPAVPATIPVVQEKTGVVDWIKNNPLPVAGVAILAVILLTRKKARKK